MKIENQIAQAVTAALKALYGIEAAPETLGIQKTKKEFEGNLTLVVFPFLKASHKAPEATAAEPLENTVHGFHSAPSASGSEFRLDLLFGNEQNPPGIPRSTFGTQRPADQSPYHSNPA